MMDWAVTSSEDASKKRKSMGASNATDVKEEAEEGSTTKGIIKDIASLTLQNTRAVKHIEGALCKSYRTAKTDAVVTAAVTAGKSYTEATRGKRGHNMGSPHLHVGAAIIRILEKSSHCDVVKIKSFMHQHGAQNALCNAIPILFVSEQFDKEKFKITWLDTPVWLEDGVGGGATTRILSEELSKYLIAEGAEELVGTAPRSPAERRVSKFLGKKKSQTGGA